MPDDQTDTPATELLEGEDGYAVPADGDAAPEATVPDADAADDADDADGDDLDDLLGLAGAGDDAEGDEPLSAVDPDVPAAPADVPAAGEAEAAPEPTVRRRPRSLAEVRDKKDLARLVGDWYVVHTYAGYEQRVKDNLENRVETLDAHDRVFEVVIPTEEVIEYKKGKKTTVAAQVPARLRARAHGHGRRDLGHRPAHPEHHRVRRVVGLQAGPAAPARGRCDPAAARRGGRGHRVRRGRRAPSPSVRSPRSTWRSARPSG